MPPDHIAACSHVRCHAMQSPTAGPMSRPSDDAAIAPRIRRSMLEPGRRRRTLRDVAYAQQKTLGVATTALVLMFIARLTLWPTGGTLPSHFETCVPCGQDGTADFILNLAIFVPVGIGLRLAGLRRRTVVLTVVAISGTIEALQFFVVPGRESDLSDLIANSSGGAVGLALADLRGAVLAPSRALAGRLAAGGALAWCVLAVAVQYALTPSLPTSIYYEQVAPDLPHYAVFDGTVLDATFNGEPFRSGRLSADASMAMRDTLLAGRAVVAARVLPGTPRPRLAPIASVYDHRRAEIFVLGRRANDLVFRMRRRSTGMGFHSPSAVLTGALPHGPAPTDTLRLSATVQSGVMALDLAGRRRRAHLRVGEGLWEAWRMLVADDGRVFGVHARAVTMLSIFDLAERRRRAHLRVGEGLWEAWRMLVADDGRVFGVHARAVTMLWIVDLAFPL